MYPKNKTNTQLFKRIEINGVKTIVKEIILQHTNVTIFNVVSVLQFNTNNDRSLNTVIHNDTDYYKIVNELINTFGYKFRLTSNHIKKNKQLDINQCSTVNSISGDILKHFYSKK